MILAPGTQLGPYRIDAPIGAGGMGEVYRATDPRVPRAVAIKVLPADVRDDPRRRARFEREARAIGSLNHPNICTLFDVGEDAGRSFLVMELVEGETLAQWLERDRLPIDDALRYAIQIAGALDRAHRAGIVHRDLKPANVMITKSGVKLLDFGLAKFKAGPIDQQSALTRPPDGTAEGTILGTLQYMSPEQLEGRDADARSDVFAFGAVVYEMITGRKAFEGKSQASLIGAILRDQPAAIATIQPLTPAALDRIVRTCLEKDPDNRWQSAGDLGRELRWISDELRRGTSDATSQRVTDMAALRRVYRRERALWIAALMVVGGAGAIAALWSGLGRHAQMSATLALHSNLSLTPADSWAAITNDENRVGSGRPSRTALALSPNGESLVFAAERAGIKQLYLRHLNSDEATPIANTEGGANPFFSPDGKWLGFWSNGALRKVSLSGGPAQEICKTGAVPIFGASWGTDDVIVFGNQGLKRVPAGGGVPVALSVVDQRAGEADHRLPFVLPDGRGVLFTVTFVGEPAEFAMQVAMQTPDGARKVLVENASDARFLPPDHLVFMRAGVLFAAPFDPVRLKLGSPIAVVADVMHAVNSPNQAIETGAAQFAMSNNGHLAYVTGGTYKDSENTLVWTDRGGNQQPIPAPAQYYLTVRLFQDGQRALAYTRSLQPNGLTTRRLWSFTFPSGPLSPIPFDGQSALYPLASPIGLDVVFVAHSKDGRALFRTRSDGGGKAEQLWADEFPKYPSSFTKDGTELLYVANTGAPGAGNLDIWALSMSDHQARPLLHESFGEADPALSPDDKWLAYTASPPGARGSQIYIRPYPNPESGRQIQISTNGGDSPRWTKGGRELIYCEGCGTTAEDVHFMSVDVGATNGFTKFVQPQTLFSLSRSKLVATRATAGFDVTPDGERILNVNLENKTPPPPTEIRIIQNWIEEVRAKIGGGE